MKINNYQLNKIESFFKKNFIKKVNNKIKREIILLKKEYKFIDVDKSLTKQTLFARALSYRVFDNKLKIYCEKKINFFLSKNLLKNKDQKFIINPMIYIRFCRPEEKLIKNYKKAKFYTEPHYDKSFDNNKFYSIWIPLEETNFETGSLCYFKIPSILRKKNFPISGKNKYSMHNYFENPENADELLTSYCEPVYLNEGDIILFNKYCLHGATKPTKKIRLSINFQVFDSKVLKSHNNNEKNKFLLSNYSMDICNFLNLLLIGDLSGAKKIYKKINKSKFKKMFHLFDEDVSRNLKTFVSGLGKINSYNFKTNYQKDLHYSKELSILKQ
tara:strand:+ start:117 stop:1103 length:987 start_codon:yes stop_codon:yes gene_type:complete